MSMFEPPNGGGRYDRFADVRPVTTNPNPVQYLPSQEPEAARRADPVVVFAIIGFIVLGVVALAVAAYLVYAVGVMAAAVAALLALVPLVIVLLAVRWIDRWEPEPKPALAFALLWGAAASVAIALLTSFGVQLAGSLVGIGPSAAVDFATSVVQAPIVEEVAKGFGILLLFWVFRRHFDGPVDGIVYGAMVAVGFAFTENIQYFGLALSNVDGGVGETFFLRGILSPFAHVMFTACTGAVLGYASRRATSAAGFGYFLLGLIPAIALHAFWNGAAYFVTNFYAYYVVVQVPLFLTAILFVVVVRRQERLATAARLGEYAAAGWFTSVEVALLSSSAGRTHGTAWAGRHGLGPQFAAFTRHATRLAFARQRVVSGRDRLRAQVDEAEQLDLITADRRALAALPPLPIQTALPR